MAVCISLSGLASAVAREGGIGVIAATAIGMLEPDYFRNGVEANRRALRREIQRARELGARALGVNIMVAASDFDSLLRVSLEEKVDVVFLGAGLPIKGIPVRDLRRAGVKVVPIVSSDRAARLIFSHWRKNHGDIPDGVVVEGPLAGGHLGFRPEQIDDPAFSLDNLVPRVVEVMGEFEKESGRRLPVIAAGGVFDGRDIDRFLGLGAGGVQLGTRFVATHECDADERFKASFVAAGRDDLTIIRSPVGLPGRALDSPFLRRVASGENRPFGCPWQCLASCNARQANYCISMALYHARKGNLEKGFAFAGANAFRVKQVVSVGELLTQLKAEFVVTVESRILSLSAEYEKALARFKTIRKETRDRLRAIRREYREKLKRRQDSLVEDYHRSLRKIEALKGDYAAYCERLKVIAAQLEEIIKGTTLYPSTLNGSV